jgi:hypothetical protein
MQHLDILPWSTTHASFQSWTKQKQCLQEEKINKKALLRQKSWSMNFFQFDDTQNKIISCLNHLSIN